MPPKRRRLSKGSKRSQQTFTPEEGVAALSFITMFADGEATEEEADALVEMLEATELFEDYSDEDMSAMFDKFVAISKEEGGEVLVNTALEALPNEDYREATYITAMVILASDEEIPEEEEEYLSGLQVLLGIDDDRADELYSELFEEEEEEE